MTVGSARHRVPSDRAPIRGRRGARACSAATPLAGIDAGVAGVHRRGNERQPNCDLFPVPLAAVLLVEQDQLAVGAVRVAPRRAAASAPTGRAAHFRAEIAQQPRERDRLAAEIGADQQRSGGGGIAFVEDEARRP